MIVWKFLKNFWYIPVFIVIAVALFVSNRRKLAAKLIKTELKASVAAQKAARNTIEISADVARKQVLIDHKEKITELRGEQRKRVSELIDDPEALSRYLVKLDSDY